MEDKGQQETRARAALYVDGFNLYHAINDLEEPFLKWCNLWQLGEILIPSKSERLVRVVFCTAYYPGDHGRRVRHERFVKALEAVGVLVVLGHFVHEDANCRRCGHIWKKPTEKETDINLALSLYDDAVRDEYDHGYFLTADSDQAATLKLLHKRFPEKKVTSVSPPGRSHSQHILAHSHAKIALSKEHLERSLFEKAVITPGHNPVVRPHEYDPPTGYVPFDQRPR